MKRILCAAGMMVAFVLYGCGPDAAVKRGSVVGAGPQTSERNTQQMPDKPIVTQPSTERDTPVTQVR